MFWRLFRVQEEEEGLVGVFRFFQIYLGFCCLLGFVGEKLSCWFYIRVRNYVQVLGFRGFVQVCVIGSGVQGRIGVNFIVQGRGVGEEGSWFSRCEKVFLVLRFLGCVVFSEVVEFVWGGYVCFRMGNIWRYFGR